MPAFKNAASASIRQILFVHQRATPPGINRSKAIPKFINFAINDARSAAVVNAANDDNDFQESIVNWIKVEIPNDGSSRKSLSLSTVLVLLDRAPEFTKLLNYGIAIRIILSG
jgi:hypothetical protein